MRTKKKQAKRQERETLTLRRIGNGAHSAIVSATGTKARARVAQWAARRLSDWDENRNGRRMWLPSALFQLFEEHGEQVTLRVIPAPDAPRRDDEAVWVVSKAPDPESNFYQFARFDAAYEAARPTDREELRFCDESIAYLHLLGQKRPTGGRVVWLAVRWA